MADAAPKKGRKKGAGRMVVANVRLTKETHLRLKALTDELGVESMSDAIDFVIFEHYPQVEQKLKKSEERRKKLDTKRSQSDN